MTAKIWKEAIVLIAIAGLIWFVFTRVDIMPDRGFELGIEQEEQLGDKLYEILESSFEQVDDEIVLDAVEAVYDRLSAHMEPTEYEYKIHVVENGQVNAFAMPGGHIVVFDGLIEFAESPEELAAVLAHEMGHCEHRHVVKRMMKELGIALITVVMAGDPGLVHEAYETVLGGVFDRAQEREADDFSLELMERSGIRPTAMASFFRRVNRELGSLDERLEFLQTHPHNNSRIKAALEYKVHADFEEQPFEIEWDEVRTILD